MAVVTGSGRRVEDGLTGRPLFALLLAGIACWIGAAIGAIVWFFATTPDPGLMVVAFPLYAWMIGYVPGGLCMILYGLFRWLRRGVHFKVLAWGALVYFLPLLLMTAVARLFLYLQPTTVQYGDEPMMISAFAGPAFVVLYLIGLVRGYGKRDRLLPQTVKATIAPPLFGVACFAAWTLWFTFTSAQWMNRGAFGLDEQRIEWRDPHGLIIEGVLRARRDGEVTMHAFYEDRRGDSGRSDPVDKIAIGEEVYENQTWTNRPVLFKSGESYRVRLIWKTLSTTSLNSNRRVVFRITEAPSYLEGRLLKEFLIRADPDAKTLERIDSKLSPRSFGGKMGYENRAGKIVIPPQFDTADEFHEGLALVGNGGRFGFINESGEVVILIQYYRASRFSEGLAVVSTGIGHFGYIDAADKFVIESRVGGGYPFAEGLARVRLPAGNGYKEGFINRSGRLVIAPEWDAAHDFSEGLAAVRKDDKWGFIDRTGKLVVEPKFSGGRLYFKEGRANVMLENRWGFVDPEGNWVPEERG